MTKVKLIIYKEDGSVYWIENFANRNDCDAWLQEEKTRPYWNSNYTTEIQEIIQLTPSLEDQKLSDIRFMRNALLADCDWTQLPDAQLSLEKKEAWKIYRQALRDFISESLDLASPNWPQRPT